MLGHFSGLIRKRICRAGERHRKGAMELAEGLHSVDGAWSLSWPRRFDWKLAVPVGKRRNCTWNRDTSCNKYRGYPSEDNMETSCCWFHATSCLLLFIWSNLEHGFLKGFAEDLMLKRQEVTMFYDNPFSNNISQTCILSHIAVCEALDAFCGKGSRAPGVQNAFDTS